MMYWIVDWSVKFRRIVMAVAAGLIVFGLLQLDDVKRDILPEFSPTTVEVQTEALGLSTAEVEQLITVPLEQDLLNGVAFLETIESASLPGLSSVVMTFEQGTDLLDARQVVAERLTQAAGLPQVASPPQMIQPLSSTSRVAMASLNSTELTPIEISVLARWVMVPRLLGVEGVANVSIWGFRDQQLQVLVDPAILADQNVTLSQVISTAGNALEVSPLSFLEASSPGTGGFIDTVNQRLHVFHEQAISTPEQLAQVSVEGPEGGAIFIDGETLALGDVAELVTDHQPLIGDAYCSGGPCILLVIEKFPEANTPQVASGVEGALEALSLGLPGMEIDTSVYRPAAFIDASVSNLRGTLVVGLILLLVVLAIMFLNWRIVMISAVSIASSLVVAGLILLMFDRTVNTMILAGLVMALIVIIDDAVVGAWGTAEGARVRDVERIRVEPAIVDSVLRLRAIALYSALIVAAAMLPVIALEGEAGAFLEPIALAYLLAIAAAIIVGLTVAPAISVFLLANGSPETVESPFSIRIREWYGGFAPHSVPRTRRALAIYGVVIVAGLIAFTSLSQSLQPALKERDVLVHLEAAPGTSLPRMDEITAQIVDELHSQPGVGSIGAHIGRAIMSDQIVNVNSAEIWVNIDPSADYEATVSEIESVVDSHAEVANRVQTYSDQRITAILQGPTDEVAVRVYGADATIRQTMAEQVREVMINVDGIDEALIDIPTEEATLEVEVDLQQAQAFGVRPGDVRRQAATLVSGLVVGNLFEDQKVFDVVVWGVPEIRQTVEDIAALPIATPSGERVPLGFVASVRIVDNPTVIRHESVATYLDVLAPVSRRTPDAVAADVDVALAEIQFPLEHHAEVLGSFADVRAARSRAVTAGIAALILIYLLLQSAFASWRLATLALLAMPMGVSGSVVAIALAGGEVSLGSIAGIAAVFALTTRGTVLMLRGFQRCERAGEPFGQDLIIGETTRLVVPSVTSAVAIAAVLLPLLFAGSRAGLELAGPMAVAVLGGLVTTVLVTAAVMPALYLRWGYVAQPDTYADDLFAPDLLAAAEVGG
jgi:Cu/Ag efflux pump CusA